MTYLGDVATGRDNNFNLIRFGLALAVMASHAWPIALGPGTVEPLEAALGRSLGTLAVWAFFALSGFFVTASFEASASPADYLLARGLRLLPCLAVSLVLVALALGPAVTALPVATYLRAPEVWGFLARNMTLLRPEYGLPGVFAGNPYPAVEGSIWTLGHEAACYALVLLAGMAGLTRRRRAMAGALAGYALLWVLTRDAALPVKAMAFRELSLPFALGMALRVWRHRVPLSGLLALGLCGLAFAARGGEGFEPLAAAAMAYGTLWLGYVPGGWIRAWNRLGDYSYGLYVYAFPLQGLAVWLLGPQGPAQNLACAVPMTLVCAILSWHAVERPALALRRRVLPAPAE